MSLNPIKFPVVSLSKKLNPHCSVLVGSRNTFKQGVVNRRKIKSPIQLNLIYAFSRSRGRKIQDLTKIVDFCLQHFRTFFIDFFSVRLLSVLRGHSVFPSPPQLPMTSDFEGFSIPDFIHYILFYLNSSYFRTNFQSFL